MTCTCCRALGEADPRGRGGGSLALASSSWTCDGAAQGRNREPPERSAAMRSRQGLESPPPRDGRPMSETPRFSSLWIPLKRAIQGLCNHHGCDFQGVVLGRPSSLAGWSS